MRTTVSTSPDASALVGAQASPAPPLPALQALSSGVAALPGLALITVAMLAGAVLPTLARGIAASPADASATPPVTREAFDTWARALVQRRAAEMH